MIRILHSVSNMDRAGIETMLMNYYRHIDRSKIQFDFLCNKAKKGAYDEEILSMGGKIYRTPGLNPVKYPQYLQFMKKLFSMNDYKIIEAHNGAFGVYALNAARKSGIPVRIFHAHGAGITKDWKLPLKYFCLAMLPYSMNEHFTCGIEAAKCYFGKNVVACNDYTLIPNAIEVERFIFNEDTRNRIRREYHLEDKHVLGHVGRFMKQKNHTFLLDVFEAYSRRDKTAFLVLLGDGELLDRIKAKAERLHIADKVLFVGNVENANEWYQAFDCFILPSVWEGLPVVGVEAQAADLPCIFSDTITREIDFLDSNLFLSTASSMKDWIDAISKAMKHTSRRDNTEMITRNHYNVRTEAMKLQEHYLKLYGE
ncbi:MAG: glycosyltransferase family 1 protein [Oscillospiraceae bacterium]|nr:glycosyltransferase family 1 protein [Oscillospiraceae bacterium]